MRGGGAGTASGGGGSKATRACDLAHPAASPVRATAPIASALLDVRSITALIVSRHLRPSTDGSAVACGSRIRNVVPVPGVDCTSISPSWSCTVRNTIDSPMPLPPAFVVK